MYKLVAFFRRHPDLTREEFIERYENGEVPVILEAGGAPPLYRRSYPIRPLGRHGADPDGQMPEFAFDVMTEVGFPDKESSDAWFAKVNSPDVNSVADTVFHPNPMVFAYEVEEHDSSAK